ncbi:Fic family protein [Polynucleobacter corsicus]|uniref:Fic family protein n=1 Tax=Polynucleobacter corsicus TaxID=2081042 RepID=UPI001BFE6842|nr:Fic family protein [Polynucleobacter corsicus]QWE19386.1 Fic family protein [Polynucleobacter corsicus]
MGDIGYSQVKSQLDLSAFDPLVPARLASVTSVTPTQGALLIPAKVAPKDDRPLNHLLFALKHEGVNLQLLSQALRKIPAQEMLATICESPTGVYIRAACFLWEAFNKQELKGAPVITGPMVNLFDPKKYITGPSIRNAKWRVNFNGLGSLDYCVTVERTARINSLLESNILQKANEFLSELGGAASDRAMSWAYLSETKSSFEIEHETPSATKAEAFVELLKKAHLTTQLDEEYLVGLQNTAITNPLDRAVNYRHQQNWLSSPLRGAAGVTYIPPPPEIVNDLMKGLVDFANTAPKQIDPLIAAAIVSFGFVFIHPFMDGNGRLSRFLFHHALCQSGLLQRGLLLPVSIAMKRNEDPYLAALKSFSEPARKRWEVIWIDGDEYQMTFKSDDSLYRYWNATACVEFGLEMAKQALEKDLREETEFLAKYDIIYRAIDGQYDIRGKDLNTLILACMEQNGKLSANRRKKFTTTVPEEIFNAIEIEYAKVVG